MKARAVNLCWEQLCRPGTALGTPEAEMDLARLRAPSGPSGLARCERNGTWVRMDQVGPPCGMRAQGDFCSGSEAKPLENCEQEESPILICFLKKIFFACCLWWQLRPSVLWDRQPRPESVGLGIFFPLYFGSITYLPLVSSYVVSLTSLPCKHPQSP